jgi:hypothetical protein
MSASFFLLCGAHDNDGDFQTQGEIGSGVVFVTSADKKKGSHKQ